MRLILLPLFLVPAALVAQVDTARGTIEGTVYDSVMRRPIAGATVQAVSAATPSGSILSATSDTRGRYTLGGVLPGRYLVGFQHAALDSMALESPTLAVDVRPGATVRANLATASPARVVASACRAEEGDSTGLLIGVMRDAGTGLTRASGQVEVRWVDLVIDKQGVGTRPRAITGPVTAEGWFAICLPAGEGIALRGASEGDTSGVRLVDILANGLVRHDVAVGGTGIVRGVVRGDRDRPLAGARVAFAGTERATTTDSAGRYTLTGPAGSQTFEVRALGYAPDRRPMVLRAGADSTIDVALVTIRRVLDTVKVVAQRIYDRDSDGFQQRRRAGNGRFWDGSDFDKGRFGSVYDALRLAPGVQLYESGFDRVVTMRGGKDGRCIPTVFFNGIRMDSSITSQLDLLGAPSDISAMELYTEAQVPAQYQTLNGCGSLLIWTRPRPRRPE